MEVLHDMQESSFSSNNIHICITVTFKFNDKLVTAKILTN